MASLTMSATERHHPRPGNKEMVHHLWAADRPLEDQDAVLMFWTS